MELEQNVGAFAADTASVLQWVESARGGNDAAFEKLIAQYRPMLTAAVKACVESDEAEEAYSEACEALHAAVLHWKPERNTTFGLYARICVRRALHAYRAFLTKGAGEELPEDQAAGESLESDLVGRETADLLMQRVKKLLSETEFSVFSDYVNGFSNEETARRRALSQKQVANARARALGKVRKAKDLLAEN